jgi:hypothetical protein
MNWNTRLHNAGRAGLAVMAFAVVIGGFSRFAPAQDASPTRKVEARNASQRLSAFSWQKN